MTNYEKYIEVFGYKPWTGVCMAPEDRPQECLTSPDYVCKDCEWLNWWDKEYRGNKDNAKTLFDENSSESNYA